MLRVYKVLEALVHVKIYQIRCNHRNGLFEETRNINNDYKTMKNQMLF